MPGPLSSLLAKGRPLVLDGAIGTELSRRGVDTGLPLWSARALLDAPGVLMQIHRDYLDVGADIITTDTFRTTRRTFQRAGMADQSAKLTRRAVDLVHSARSFYPQRTILVAGSLGPLEDCYRPDLVPPDSVLQEEHPEHAQRLADAGADFLFLETFGSIREAKYACVAALATGKEVVVSFLCTANGKLYSGESLEDAVAAIFPLKPTAYGLNCVPARSMEIPLGELKRILLKLSMAAGGGSHEQTVASHMEIGRDKSTHSGRFPGPCVAVYANVGRPGEELSGELILDVGPEEYGRLAHEWVRQGAKMVGGCCGTTPEHIAAVSRALQ
jgi:S-methylmethionine-dependent homocysteine/selenocysteine methylase